MKFDKSSLSYTLYVCTDSKLMTSPSVESSVEAVLKGGADIIQLREKELTSRGFYELALRVKAVTDSYGKPLIINDRADIALAAGAAGVHLGQSDLPCTAARKLLGEEAIIGVTAPSVELAEKAQADGADYIGVGAMFTTSTKSDARANTKENLAAIRAAVDIPIVIIGGIKRTNLHEFIGMGINGAAVISDIIADPDSEGAASEMKVIAERL